MRIGHLIGPELRAILHDNPAELRTLLEEIHPEDIADVFAELPEDEAAALLARFDAGDAAAIFERFADEKQEDIATALGTESVAHIAAEMAPDDRVELLAKLGDEMSEAVLARLERVAPEAAEEVAEIDKWPPHSAGRLMTTEYVAVRPGAVARDAVAAVRAAEVETLHYVYVTGSDNRLYGVVSLRDLLLAQPNAAIDEISRENVIAVEPTMDQEDAARRMAKYDLAALPVVDELGIVLGIITVDDIIDVLTEEQTEDVQRLGAVEPLEDTYFATTFWTFIRKRGLWLLGLFVSEFFTGSALRHYDSVLQTVTKLSFYIPLLVSTGGNSGGQSSSLVIRGIAVGEIKLRDWWRVLGRELAQGLVLGAMLAAVGFGRVMIWGDGPRFGCVVALTLVGIVIMGCTVGSMMPFLLKRLGVDPATSSAPFIATMTDVIGIIIYFNVAQLLLAEVLRSAPRLHS